LIELILTIILIGIIGFVGSVMILKGTEAYLSEGDRADLTDQGRLAIERMAREIRTVRRASDIAAPGGNPTSTLQFVDVNGTTITYSLSGTDLNRTVGGVPSPLAASVTTLQFNHYDKSGALTTTSANIWKIRIDLTVSLGSETQSFRIQLHPRNFT
jgi:hypothetical protein